MNYFIDKKCLYRFIYRTKSTYRQKKEFFYLYESINSLIIIYIYDNIK